jgi:hypothetical protein
MQRYDNRKKKEKREMNNINLHQYKVITTLKWVCTSGGGIKLKGGKFKRQTSILVVVSFTFTFSSRVIPKLSFKSSTSKSTKHRQPPGTESKSNSKLRKEHRRSMRTLVLSLEHWQHGGGYNELFQWCNRVR